ncbi:hypothetical protein [Saccharopolyspora sp. 6V]|uniref:DUF7426 family protein n=1 Tax=Saccharopolyspora sp. 6V TaxID=2877239 RepID=UPI001CD463C0|nr:hypothetical protein [Saccharopolyspora sp. 6V]MCA1195135.1 hypothetical protein [Saccharopolyspora sp. 6V]
MALRDLSELLDPALTLPIGGKLYRVTPVSAETGLRLQRLHDYILGVTAAAEAEQDTPAPDAELLDDAAELDLMRSSLGAAYDEMIADGVPYAHLRVAGMTAFVDIVQGREAAERHWSTGGRPPAPAGNRATRRAARSTPRPDSASGTTPPRKAPAAKAAGTRGATSSTTGR